MNLWSVLFVLPTCRYVSARIAAATADEASDLLWAATAKYDDGGGYIEGTGLALMPGAPARISGSIVSPMGQLEGEARIVELQTR